MSDNGNAGRPLTRREMRERAEAERAAHEAAPPPVSAPAPAAPVSRPAPPSRRSLRESDAPTGASGPPIVRPPAGSGGMRSLDATGRLTPVHETAESVTIQPTVGTPSVGTPGTPLPPRRASTRRADLHAQPPSEPVVGQSPLGAPSGAPHRGGASAPPTETGHAPAAMAPGGTQVSPFAPIAPVPSTQPTGGELPWATPDVPVAGPAGAPPAFPAPETPQAFAAVDPAPAFPAVQAFPAVETPAFEATPASADPVFPQGAPVASPFAPVAQDAAPSPFPETAAPFGAVAPVAEPDGSPFPPLADAGDGGGSPFAPIETPEPEIEDQPRGSKSSGGSSYTWLQYIILFAVALVLGFLIWKFMSRGEETIAESALDAPPVPAATATLLL